MRVPSLVVPTLLFGFAATASAADAQEAFPAVGHVYEAHFSADTVFKLDFTQAGQMTYTSLAGPTRGKVETVHYTAVPVQPPAFMVYWREADGTCVVHVENFGRGHVWTNIALPGGEFVHLDGELKQVR